MSTPTAPASAPTEAPERVQVVGCGPHLLGFAYGWARAVLELTEAPTPVPNTPAWLLGVANLDGQVVPVVDLAEWLAPGVQPQPNAWQGATGTTWRVLLGGAGETQLALRFNGLPLPLPWRLQTRNLPAVRSSLPAALQPLVLGLLNIPAGWGFRPGLPGLVLNPNALYEALEADLLRWVHPDTLDPLASASASHTPATPA